MKKIYIFLIVVFCILMMVLPVIAEPSYIFRKETDTDMKISCFDINNSLCNNVTDCYLTINMPSGANLIRNETMTYNYDYFNYTLNTTQTVTLGEYTTIVRCQGTENAFSTFTYLITPSGESTTEGKAIFSIGLMAVLVFFLTMSLYMFVKFDNLLVRVGMIGLSYLFLIAITFIGWNMASNFLSFAPFLADMLRILFFVLIIGALPLLVGAFIWYVIMLFKIKEIERLMERGLDYNEAERRTRR